MDSCRAILVAFPPKVNGHAPVTVNAIMFMINLTDLFLNRCFLGIILRLPVFPVVVVSVRIDTQPAQKPTDAEFAMVLVDKSISL